MERKDWKGQYKMVKLNEVCRASSSNIILKNIKEKTGDYPVYGASGYIQNIDSYHCNEPYIGIIKDGAGVGKVEIYPAYSSLLGTMQYIHASEKVDLRYIYYKLRSLDFTQYINGAAIPHIYFKDYGQEIIPVPPLPVQARIVDELDCLQGILSKKRQQLAEYHSLAQAIFHQMFGDPVVNEKGWEMKRLGEVFDITSSKRIYQNELLLEGIPFYKVSDIVSLIDKNEVVPNSFISEYTYKDLVKNGNVPQANDLLITSRGTLGKCYIVKMNDKFYFQDGMVTWLRQKEEPILPTYVSYVFLENSFKSYLYKNAKHTTVDYISIQHLSKMLIPLPPLPLQQSFAARIAAIDSQRERLAASIRELETLLACRMETLLNCPQA